MRRLGLIVVLAAVGIVWPAVQASAIEEVTIAHEGLTLTFSGETVTVSGVLHLRAVQNANGTTLHANLSNAEAVGETSGRRWKITGSEKTTVPTGPGEITWSPTYSAHDFQGGSGIRQLRELQYVLVVTFDSAGAIQRATINSVRVGR